jgi:hypothetical protein
MNKRDKAPRNSGMNILKESPVAYRTNASEECYPLQMPEDEGWVDFRDQCRRQMERPLALRIKYGFSRPINPPTETPHSRAFKTMAEYRAWCEKTLPAYLGFKRPVSTKEKSENRKRK